VSVTNAHYRPGRVIAALVNGTPYYYDVDAIRIYLDVNIGNVIDQYSLSADTEAVKRYLIKE
jgi:hypothetical protein